MKFETRQGNIVDIELTYRECANNSAGDFFTLFLPLSPYVPFETLRTYKEKAATLFHETDNFNPERKTRYAKRLGFFTELEKKVTQAVPPCGP